MSRALVRAAMAAGCALLAAGAEAHPLDEVIQAAYLTLAPGEVQLDLEIEPGSLVAGRIARVIDANGDGRISPAEARAYAERVLAQSSLIIDGVAVPLRLDRIDAPVYGNLVQGDILRIRAVAGRRTRAGPGKISYLNRYDPLKSQCQANVFLSMGSGWRFTVDSQGHSPDGRRLDVAYRAIRGA